MNLSGHFWTVVPTLVNDLLPRDAPRSLPWSTDLDDPTLGRLTLRGELCVPTGARVCLVIVHGLGGTTDTFYCKAAARAADALGVATLRLALRGADRRGEDFYHGGLVADLAAALASPALAHFDHLLALGFSLGGHMVLRYGLQPDVPRLRAVGAICPPLELGRTADAIHRPQSVIYERFILRALLEIYEAVDAQGRAPTPLRRVKRVGSLRQWDALTVVPRFGFADVDAYYREMSVGPQLADIQLPALIVHSDADPMIPPDTFEEHWATRPPQVTWCRTPAGGHVGFPERVDLGLGLAAPSVEAQAVEWLLRQLPGAAD